jgi:Cysteine-rich secretory protein family
MHAAIPPWRLIRGAATAGMVFALCAASNAADLAGDVTRKLLQRTNELRAASGWKPVRSEPRLGAAAAHFAQYMADTDRYGHDVDGRQPSERAKAQGYDHCLTAENIAFASSTRGFDADELAQRLFDGWVQSPPHRRNLLDGDMTEVGMAVAQSARSGRHYAVQLFARPKSLAVRITLINRSRDTVQYELGGERHELKPNVIRTHDRCRRALLALSAEGLDAPSAKPMEVTHGARYRIEDAGDGIRLRQE